MIEPHQHWDAAFDAEVVMYQQERKRLAGAACAIVICVTLILITGRLISPAFAAAGEADKVKVWVSEKWNVLTQVPKDWSWKGDFAADVPVVFRPTEEKQDIPNFIFLTYLGKQGKNDLEETKKEYIRDLKDNLESFKLNSVENASTIENLQAFDFSYTFTVSGKPALGYDRLVFAADDIVWAISFSAGKENFKQLKDAAMGIIDAFVFDAEEWLKEH